MVEPSSRRSGAVENLAHRSGIANGSPAAGAWADALSAWAVPPEILAAAPQPPWGFPPSLFAASARRAMAPDAAVTPSGRRALEALPEGGTVLDVGVGGGAASLPLAPPASLVVGVDESPGMLEVFAVNAAGKGVAHRTVHGPWPDAAGTAGPADVVVCHHVLYNVADIAPFADALTRRARRRVVVELTADHPLARMNPLWRAIHGVERPASPVAADAVAALVELGLAVEVEEWERPPTWGDDDRAELVAFTRRRLCVGPERDAEIEELLARHPGPSLRPMMTVWWAGRARATMST